MVRVGFREQRSGGAGENIYRASPLHPCTPAPLHSSPLLPTSYFLLPGNKLRPALLAGSVDSRTLRELHLVGVAWPQKDMDSAFRLAEASQTPMPLMERVFELVVKMSREDLQGLFGERN